MQNIFIIVSSILAIVSPLIYARAILQGRAKPHRTTRLILLLISALATAALFAQNDRVAIWLAAASTLQSIIIFALSFKYGMGGWAKIDIFCLFVALIGIIIWRITDQPVLGLYFAIAADFTGMIPALIKTYQFPNTEIWSFYLLDFFAATFSLLALQSWTIQGYSYPVYIIFINLLMVLLIVQPFSKRMHNKH